MTHLLDHLGIARRLKPTLVQALLYLQKVRETVHQTFEDKSGSNSTLSENPTTTIIMVEGFQFCHDLRDDAGVMLPYKMMDGRWNR